MLNNKFIIKAKTPERPQTYQLDPFSDPAKMNSEELTASIKYFLDLQERKERDRPPAHNRKTLMVNRFIKRGH